MSLDPDIQRMLDGDEEPLEIEVEMETEDIASDPADIPQHANDIDFLRDLLDQATAQSAEEKRLKQARKRLQHIQKRAHPEQVAEQTELLTEIRRLEEVRVWQTTGCVALFHRQKCSTCESVHEYFLGWFTVRTHATDLHLRDLRRGEPVEALPHWVEVEDRGLVPVCANCVELRIAAEVALGSYPEA